MCLPRLVRQAPREGLYRVHPVALLAVQDFLAWTTSKEFCVRLFYFGFAVLLCDMWLLVDFLVQTRLDVDIKHRFKRRVTAKRFLNLVRKHHTGIG